MSNVYLVGMMGSGKSVTGRSLAALLGRPFKDLDREIEAKYGATIPEIFETKGEAAFRKWESETLREISERSGVIVATGGGIVSDPENVRVMKAAGRVIYLKTSPETLWQRVRGQKHRPLLNNAQPRQTLEELLLKRENAYQKAADAEINTDGKTAGESAAEILKLLETVQ